MENTKPYYNSQIELLAIEAFKSSGFLIVNKTLIKQIGLVPAILLSNYIDKYNYFKNKYKNNDGWFYLTHEQQTSQLNIGEYSIIKYKNLLKEKGILKTKRKGIPAKEYYQIDFNKLVEYLQFSSKRLDTAISRGQDKVISKGHNKETKTIRKPKFIRKKGKNRIPPSIELVIKYCQERNSSVDPNTFHDWNTSKNWMIGKNKMVDWQAAIRTWERKDKQQNKRYTTPGSRRSNHSSSEFRTSDKTIKNN